MAILFGLATILAGGRRGCWSFPAAQLERTGIAPHYSLRRTFSNNFCRSSRLSNSVGRRSFSRTGPLARSRGPCSLTAGCAPGSDAGFWSSDSCASTIVSNWREYLEKLRDAVAAGIAAGQTLEEMQATITMDEYSDVEGFDWVDENVLGMYHFLTD